MAKLPIREMVLYKHGVGYFVRGGQFEGDHITLEFLTDDINDVLKSLTVLDRAGGKVLGVNYQTEPSINFRNANSSITLSPTNSQLDLIRDLRGRLVTCTIRRDEAILELTGRIVGVEAMEKGRTSHRMVLQTDANDIHFFDLEGLLNLIIHDEQSQQDLTWFLDKSLNSKQRQRVNVRLTEGVHNLTMSYVAPSPTWRVSYRFVAEADADNPSGRGLLQGWGVFDNNFNEDLEDVQVTFVAGQPISFVYDLYSATIPPRPIVEDEARVLSDAIAFGSVTAGAPIGMATGATHFEDAEPQAKAAGGLLRRIDGGKRAQAMQAPMDGTDRIRTQLQSELSQLSTREEIKQKSEVLMQRLLDEESLVMSRRDRNMILESVLADVLGSGIHDLAIDDMVEGTEVESSSEQRGEFFQYSVNNPVSVKRGESSLIPILSNEVNYTKELLYNHAKLADHPVIAVRFDNTTGLTLERGPITIVENSDYKGEAILSFTKPHDTLFLAYAVELNVHVVQNCTTYHKTVGLNIENGFIILETYEIHQCIYRIENTLAHAIQLTLEENLPPNFSDYEAFDTAEPDLLTTKERRWSVQIPAQQKYRFVRKDRKKIAQRTYVRNLQYKQLEYYLQNRWLDEATYHELDDILSRIQQVKQLQGELNTIQQDRAKLNESQQQIRENLGSLQATSEQEARLRERMLNKLEATQDQLDQLEAHEVERNAEIVHLNGEIEAAIQNLG